MWYDITKKQWFMEVCMKKIISILLFVLLTASFLITVSACTVIYKSEPLPDREKYTGPYSEVNGAFAGTDDLDRELTTDNSTYAENEKTVGIFYFLWQGEHGIDGPYDNNKIVQANPNAVDSEKNWICLLYTSSIIFFLYFQGFLRRTFF